MLSLFLSAPRIACFSAEPPNRTPGESNNLTALSMATSWVDLVEPAVALVVHTRERASELITDDLPTFGKPTTAAVTPVLIPRRRLKGNRHDNC